MRNVVIYFLLMRNAKARKKKVLKNEKKFLTGSKRYDIISKLSPRTAKKKKEMILEN